MNKKNVIWLLGIGAASIAIINDLGGAMSLAKTVLSAAYEVEISLVWSLLLLLPLTWFAVLAMRPNTPHAADVVSIDNSGQFFEKIQSQIVGAKREVIAIGLEKDWVFPMIPSIAIARCKDRTISVGYFDEFHERYRLLEMLGCQVTKLDSQQERDRFCGLLSDPEDILNCRATVRTARKNEAIYGRHYFSALDFGVILASCLHLRNLLPDDRGVAASHIPELVEVEETVVLALLRAVRFYDRANFAFEEVSISDTRPVSSYVSKFKLQQASDIVQLYDERGWSLFRPCGMTLQNGNTSVWVPPVLEEHDGELYIAEGHSRLFTLRKRAIKSVRAIVVRGVAADLPMKPTVWRKVSVVDEKREKGNPQLARYIETSTHLGVWGKID